ncbi:MAG: hypothetical protein F6K14_07635 [Symploca sp. SIO2C1]|nr:hypothetical protein [Symploca sp. SIO2C1]
MWDRPVVVRVGKEDALKVATALLKLMCNSKAELSSTECDRDLLVAPVGNYTPISREHFSNTSDSDTCSSWHL